jgi:hypothetical protein
MSYYVESVRPRSNHFLRFAPLCLHEIAIGVCISSFAVSNTARMIPDNDRNIGMRPGPSAGMSQLRIPCFLHHRLRSELHI